MKIDSPALSRLIERCDRFDFGVERQNARLAKLGRFDASALTIWVADLARSVDCEPIAKRRPEIRVLATAALRELLPQVEGALAKDETSAFVLRIARQFAR
jgi:hypothetical protein